MATAATDPSVLRQRMDNLRARTSGQPPTGTDPEDRSLADTFASTFASLPDTIADFLGNANVGIAQTLGLPSDLLSAVIPRADPSASVLGSKGLQRALAAIGAAPEPGSEGDDFTSRTAQNLGAALVPLLGFIGKGAKIAAAGETVLSPLAEVFLSAFRNPGKTALIEAGGAAGAAEGGLLAEKAFPDSPLARTFGELSGGLAGGGLAPIVPKTIQLVPKTIRNIPKLLTPIETAKDVGRGVVRAVGKKLPNTEANGLLRAGRRARSVVVDPDEALRRLENDDTFSGLSAAERSGEPGLVALQDLAASEDIGLTARLARGKVAATGEARSALRFSGRPEAARQFLDNLVGKAVDRADQLLSRVAPGASIRAASLAARAGIDRAFDAAKSLENSLWKLVPGKVLVKLKGTQTLLRDELLNRNLADDPADIPRFVTNFLGSIGDDGVFAAGILGDANQLRAVRTIRTRIGTTITAERAKDAPNRNKIRILVGLEDALLEDLSLSPGGDKLQEAIAFSRDLNERFRRGIVGELLGFEVTGAGRIAPESTLETALIRRGEEQGVAARQLQAATRDIPDAAIQENIDDFTKQLFQDQAVDSRTGLVKPKAADRFQQQNKALLEESPALRDDLASAADAQLEVDTMLGQSQARAGSATQRAKTATAIFLNAPVDQEINRVVRSNNPAATMRSLMKTLQADESGEALRGLKASFGEFLMKNSKTSVDLADGSPALSGGRMRRLVDDNKAAVKTLYSAAERRRLDKIIRTFEAQDAGRGKLPNIGTSVVNDLPSTILDLIVRTIGARRGAQLGKGVTGASLQTSKFGSELGRNFLRGLTNDKAREIIIAAIEDPKLMAALLREPAKATASDFRKIRAFLVVPASSAVRQDRQEPAPGSAGDLRRRLQKLRSSRSDGSSNIRADQATLEPGDSQSALGENGSIASNVEPGAAPDDPRGIRRFLNQELAAPVARVAG